MGSLDVQGLSKRFGSHVVLDNITFSVAEGEFFVLVGPSGGGKSTVLKLICGIEMPDSGRIFLNGRDITPLPPRQRNVGMVFQDYGLYPHMNVFENIAYGLEARGMPRDEVSRRVQEAAAKLGLTPLLDRVVVDLSGGEQQRVALARALAKDADIYLFDEPLSNLDPKLRAQARRDIQMVHRAKGKPSLYVTHDQSEALAIADRIAVIAKGRLQQVGTPNDLLRHPANTFVAGFLGTPSMNLLRGRLVSAPEGFGVEVLPDFVVRLPQTWNTTLQAYSKDQVILGLPPVAFFLPGAQMSEAGVVSTVEAEVDFVEAMVSEVVVAFRLGQDLFINALLANVDETLLQPGRRLTLHFDGDRACLFDPETEQALLPA
ncbi:MAG: ABC transporter ATP-binding protein [Anaerolineales bacterium]|nr:ABC transporter ATP-binding protein [Anaerolineales bacterium]MCX7609285.1 ABC transporter ATP-binding protein [Anaerolineales bacterium]MDW8227140.1 ABC transporter ATP-binding protein [Anaerolineales bacterium]